MDHHSFDWRLAAAVTLTAKPLGAGAPGDQQHPGAEPAFDGWQRHVDDADVD
jgi:hypothetical protein